VATDFLERRTIISGLGISQIGRRTGRSAMDLTLESVLAAIADAGITRDEVDGVASLGETPVGDVQDSLRLDLSWNGGGMTFAGLLSPVVGASLAIAAGLARHVVIYRTVAAANMGAGQGALRAAASAEAAGRISGPMQWTVPYHVYGTMPTHAMMLRRHMHLYGTTKEQLGWIPITERYHAGLNPRATYREPMTLDDYLGARKVCEPISLFDCDVPVDGSIALVLSAADHAAGLDHPAVRIHAVGGAITDRGFTWEQRSDFPKTMMFEAAQQLWSRADVTVDDIDVAEIYDGFSFIALSWLEALGFCGLGEGGAFVEGGERIRLGGRIPINTYGGQLSAGRMHGYWLLHEACTQLRGEGGERQVGGAEVAVAAAGNGPYAGCMVLVRD
jgi:acetyl-CoA acetyltransferase